MYTKMFICTQKCTYVHNNVHMYTIHACAQKHVCTQHMYVHNTYIYTLTSIYSTYVCTQNMYVHKTCIYTTHVCTH